MSKITINEEFLENVNDKIKQLGTYSTDETDTGMTWINGEKIYRKVFSGNIVSSETAWTNFINASGSNIKQLVKLQGFFKEATGNILAFPRYETNQYFIQIRYNISNNYFQMYGTHKLWEGLSCYLIVEYLK